MAIHDTFAARLLTALTDTSALSGVTLTSPNMGLHTTAASSSADTSGTEVVDDFAYQREPLIAQFGVTTGTSIQNTAGVIQFPPASGDAWGLIVGWGVYTLAAHGTGFLLISSMGTTFGNTQINDGDQGSFGSGTVTWTIQ